MSNEEATSEPRSDMLAGVPSIARYLGITPRKVHHQIDKGGLPTFWSAGVLCARRSSIEAWLIAAEAKAGTVPRKVRSYKPRDEVRS